jgi:hypothetical protein
MVFPLKARKIELQGTESTYLLDGQWGQLIEVEAACRR